MVRIRRTTDVESHVRYGSVYGRNVEFDRGDDVVDPDVETAFWAADQFDDLELVATTLPTDYPTLRAAASAAETDVVSGNDPKERLIEWIDGLDAPDREALLAEIGERDEPDPTAEAVDVAERTAGDDGDASDGGDE